MQYTAPHVACQVATGKCIANETTAGFDRTSTHREKTLDETGLSWYVQESGRLLRLTSLHSSGTRPANNAG
jgi:hypothetical protein